MEEKKRGPGRPKGSKNKNWVTAEMRRARSKRMKERWANATPEQKAEWTAHLRKIGFNKNDPEEIKKRHSKIDIAARGEKIGATLKRKYATGELDVQHLIDIRRNWWNNLSDAEREERNAVFRKTLKLNRKLLEEERARKKDYGDVRYKEEQARLYQVAKSAMVDTGIVPMPGQSLAYYRKIIEFFRPDLVDWEV